jgi:hypothetical protein
VATLSTCKLTEIVSLADISDVYNVSTGQDPDEFIIRKIRHGITLYFSSTMRDAIIKVHVSHHAACHVLMFFPLQEIRTAKGSMKNVQVAGPERFSRLTNVTATLLQIGMISSIYEEDDLRESGLELLSAICSYLDYDGPAIVPMRGLCRFSSSKEVKLTCARGVDLTTNELPGYTTERKVITTRSTTHARFPWRSIVGNGTIYGTAEDPLPPVHESLG